MVNLLNFIFVFVPRKICKCMLNILISVGLAQWTICCHPNDHLEWDDNICSISLWSINSFWAGWFVLSESLSYFGWRSLQTEEHITTEKNKPLKLVVRKDLRNKTCSFNLSEEANKMAKGSQNEPRSLGDASQRQRPQVGDVRVDSGHMLSAACQHCCLWYDFSKDI